MNQRETSVSLVKKVFNSSFQFLRTTPSYFNPFITLAILEFIALIFLYLAPRVPLRAILGPPIKTFWGENFLHYPLNFILLPKLISHARLVLSVVFGSLLSGVAVAIILDIYNNKRVQIPAAFKVSIKKYLPLFGILFIVNVGFLFTGKLITSALMKYFYAGHAKLLFLGPKLWLGLIFIILNFIIAIFIQAIFAYAIPAIIIDNKGFFRSIGRSFCFFIKFFIPTILLVLLPMLLFIPLIVLGTNNLFLIDKLFPEITLWVEGLSIIVGTLIIDPLVTMATTLLYLMKRES